MDVRTQPESAYKIVAERFCLPSVPVPTCDTSLLGIRTRLKRRLAGKIAVNLAKNWHELMIVLIHLGRAAL
jgi:hypothetical protein